MFDVRVCVLLARRNAGEDENGEEGGQSDWRGQETGCVKQKKGENWLLGADVIINTKSRKETRVADAFQQEEG